jgi:hypothetical protein
VVVVVALGPLVRLITVATAWLLLLQALLYFMLAVVVLLMLELVVLVAEAIQIVLGRLILVAVVEHIKALRVQEALA